MIAHVHVLTCVFVQVCVASLMHLFSSNTEVFEHVILLFGPLCEIVDIAFSVELPIGFSHMADNNRRLIWS